MIFNDYIYIYVYRVFIREFITHGYRPSSFPGLGNPDATVEAVVFSFKAHLED